MPPRKRTVGVVTPDKEEDVRLTAPHQGIDLDELSPDVERVLAELGENASAVIVHRMKDAKPGEWDYITRLSASEYTTEFLKEQFGGGEYKVTIIDARQGPLNPVFVSIDRRFVGKLFAASPASPLTVSGNDPFKDRLLEILLARALTPPPAPASTELDTVLKVAAIFATNNNNNGNVAEQVAALMTTATELAKSMNPPEGLPAVASAFLPVLERIVAPNGGGAARRLANPAAAARVMPAAPLPAAAAAAAAATPTLSLSVSSSPTPAAAAAAAADVAGTIIPKWLAPFRVYASRLLSAADREADATLYADLCIEELQNDDDVFAAATQAMHEKRLLSDFFAVAPDMQLTEKRKTFAAEFVARVEEGLTDILSQPDVDDDAETKANG